MQRPNGIASADTFARVLARMNPPEFQPCFLHWIRARRRRIPDEVMAVDGQTLRHWWDRTAGKSAIHRVGAWATANRRVLGPRQVNDPSHEITAIPELLRGLALKDCVVTVDATGGQTDIAELIIQHKGDYLLALKGHLSTLHADVPFYFQEARQIGFKGIPYDFHETVDGDHGRIETHRYYTITALEGLRQHEPWPGWNMIGRVESTREIQDQTTQETRYTIGRIGG